MSLGSFSHEFVTVVMIYLYILNFKNSFQVEVKSHHLASFNISSYHTTCITCKRLGTYFHVHSHTHNLTQVFLLRLLLQKVHRSKKSFLVAALFQLCIFVQKNTYVSLLASSFEPILQSKKKNQVIVLAIFPSSLLVPYSLVSFSSVLSHLCCISNMLRRNLKPS